MGNSLSRALQPKRILVTGNCGFIGHHLTMTLLKAGVEVVAFDCINEYYSRQLKLDRLTQQQQYPNFHFYEADLCAREKLIELFSTHRPELVCHLAAQAGVRYSLENPFSYQKSNLEGFINIIEVAKDFKVENFVYASSSSVYGGNTKFPFSEADRTDAPISLYAATKKSNELVAHTYSHLFKLPTTGLRFFTVYGPWGRPDMALFKFTKNILEGKPIEVYNHGKMMRDFTYVDDIVNGILSALAHPHACEVFNLAGGNSVSLMDFIIEIEKCLEKKALITFKDMQQGDVEKTEADISHARELLGYHPRVSVQEGIAHFVKWYRSYYR